jgi:hypothetical protein
MALSKVNAKVNNIDRIVEYGKRDILQLVDKSTKEVLADVKLWSWRRLNPIQEGAPTYSFRFVPPVDVLELVPNCVIAFNNRLHDVVVRDKPDSVLGIEWTFKTKPTNETLD